MRTSASLLLLAALVGCEGSPAAGQHAPIEGSPVDASTALDTNSGSDANLPADATSADAASADAASADVEAAAAPVSWDGRVPQNHRAAPAACPTQRAPGEPCPDAGGPPSSTNYACAQDSDCSMGKNGRCFSDPSFTLSSTPTDSGGLQAQLSCETFCSYDQCFSDSDCPSRQPCACRFASVQGSANVCLPGGNCAVDSDCGPGGFCSPSGVVGEFDLAYFCRTANDTCVDDSDCGSDQWGPGGCSFTISDGYWSCKMASPPPQ